jgi:NADH-quinone oxidoreductase subunit N
MTTITIPSIHYLAILPILIFTGAALALLISTALVRGRLPRVAGTWVTVAASVAALVVVGFQWRNVLVNGPSTTIANSIVLDGFAVVATGIIAVSMGLTALVADGWLEDAGYTGVDLHILALSSAAGAMMMAAANDLVIIFLGLEILSIALYVLAAFDRRSERSGEAALKYFLLGGFASAIFVYGIALTYGATGTTQLTQISDFLAQNLLKSDGLLLAGAALLLVGFAFKVAAVPFHAWSPDVYEGSPTPVTGFMAAVVKVGAFAAVLRVFSSALFTQQTAWRPIVFALAVLSLLAGAGLAVVQRNIKRMLAYSSISHAGFILMGLWAASPRGSSASLYYLMVYSLMVIGTFAIVTVVSANGREDISDYRGLGRRRPALAAALTVLLLAQAGTPFTTGFLAKLSVLEATIQAQGPAADTLAVIAMIATAIGVYFYLRVVVLCYSGEAEDDGDEPAPSVPVARLSAVGAGIAVDDDRDGASADRSTEPAETDEVGPDQTLRVPVLTSIAIFLCVAPTIVFGVWPSPLADLAQHASMLFHP